MDGELLELLCKFYSKLGIDIESVDSDQSAQLTEKLSIAGSKILNDNETTNELKNILADIIAGTLDEKLNQYKDYPDKYFSLVSNLDQAQALINDNNDYVKDWLEKICSDNVETRNVEALNSLLKLQHECLFNI